MRVRAVFENPDGRLMPGQFVRLRMAGAKAAPLLAVSERAIGTDQNKKFVMVVDENNIAAYREVALGAFVDGLRVVTSGLAAGERIVVNGLQRVRPGALVAPEAVHDERTNHEPGWHGAGCRQGRAALTGTSAALETGRTDPS